MKGDFVNRNSIAFLAQLKLVKSGLPGYATLLGVDPDDVTAQAADCDYFEYCLRSQNILHHASREATNWKETHAQRRPIAAHRARPARARPAHGGDGGGPRHRGPLPRPRQTNQDQQELQRRIGQALGIEGAQQTPPDLTTIQPFIGATATGNAVQIGWNWQGYSAYLDLCEIQVDRGGGHGFVPLTFDTTPGYTDNQPFPATPTKWTYRAIYRVGDAQVGVWSPPVSVNVP